MKSLFRIVSQSEPFSVQKQDGSTISKSTVVLQELGGKFENSFVCALLGAQTRFSPGDCICAALRFSAREYQGNYYQDVSLQDFVVVGK